MLNNEERRLLQLFGEVLDYPGIGLSAAARECQRLLTVLEAEAAQTMQAYVEFIEGETLARRQEIYTRTFDITPTTNLYVGYHLFGESYKRGAFLAKLREAFELHHFSGETELPDHLCVLLRFAGSVHEPEFVDPLLQDGILPALDKIEAAFRESTQGYALPIRALRLFLRHAVGVSSDEYLEYEEVDHAEGNGHQSTPWLSFCHPEPVPPACHLAQEQQPVACPPEYPRVPGTLCEAQKLEVSEQPGPLFGGCESQFGASQSEIRNSKGVGA